MSRTYSPKASEIERRWLVVDADGQTLGRLATRVARLLSGKHKAQYATHIDVGDHVIVVNAAKIRVTGDKLESVRYARHSGYPGGFREEMQRAFVLHRFEQYLGGAAVGLIVFSIGFGLGHALQGWDATVMTGILGAFWGIVYLRRRSFVAPLVCHAVFNLVEVVYHGFQA